MRARSLLLIGLLLVGAGCDEKSDRTPPGARTAEGSVTTNRLAKERSPYLRQHQHNPVDWYPWGEEAFARARADDKPVLLSVGYAACHWCHVMEHESFEDEETAKALNAAFVCVKVDREERPDVDRVYMSFVQMRSGRGGWPMTVLLTHDARPFWGGTYLPKPAVLQLCANVTSAWKEHRKDIEQAAAAYAEQVALHGEGPDVPETDDSDAQILETMRNALGARFDPRHGGYGSRPKFPPHTELLYFLDAGGARMRDEERRQVLATLDAMERGGIHDQAGGGFHRYSTDERWFLPHFEKMLYDNALLAQAYAAAYAQTKTPRYRRVVERLFAWLEREMKRPGGGYASSLDADTEGEEGTTYTWSADELEKLLSTEEYALLTPLYGIEARGNFMDEASHERTGRNILHWTQPLADAARARGMEPAALSARTDALLDRLMDVRSKRAQPGLDDKVITGWNGLLLSAFARAGRDLENPAYLERGRDLARFLLEHARRADGTLLRFPKGSGPEIPGFGEDHVHLIDGLLDLAEATKEDAWADAARVLTDRFDEEFEDKEGGGFYATSAKQHEVLIARSKETWDSPIPSENGVAARVHLRLHALTGEARYRRAADRTLSTFRPLMAHPGMTSGTMALIRALTMRMEMEAAGEAPAVRGDVHVHQGVVQADVFLEYGEAAPGTRVGVVVRVALDEGWHVNASTPGAKDLTPTRLATSDDAPARLDDVRFPAAVEKTLDSLGQGPLRLHEGTFEIRAVLVVPAGAPRGPRRIPVLLGLQACDARTCQPPQEIHLDVPLRFADENGARRHPTLFR